MAGLGGAESISGFARETWAKLTPGQQAKHAAAAPKPYSLDSADAEAHKAQAIALDKAGDGAGAVRSFRAAVREAPDSSAHAFNLGAALFDLSGTPGEAAQVLQKALELDPENSDASELLQEALAAQKEL
jgi:Flp pilus assembly protein TadD